MIRAELLRKTYGSLVAVNDLTIEIRRGETFGLLGPNGAGKSTTIAMLIGALRPDSGSVTLDGSGDASNPANRRRIGIAPQSLSLYEELTADENLRFFGKLYGLRGSALKARTNWCLDFAGLADRRSDKIAHYSGGMKRRLNMACALVHEPDVVMFDEPTVGVDPQSRSHIFDCIEQLRDSGRTIIYTTHYMEEAQRLCDRVGIMDRGTLLDLDTVNGLIARHGGKSIVEARFERKPDAETVSKLPGSLDDLTLRIETENPMESLAQLNSLGSRFDAIQIKRPDLETVFLALTGRSLRDE